jgi:hypothetical protein
MNTVLALSLIAVLLFLGYSALVAKGKKRLKVELYSLWAEIHLTPSIKFVYDRDLYGYRCIDIVWLNRGISFEFNFIEGYEED